MQTMERSVSTLERCSSAVSDQQSLRLSTLKNVCNRVDEQSTAPSRCMKAFTIVAMSLLFSVLIYNERKLSLSVHKSISTEDDGLRTDAELDFDAAFQIAYGKVIAETRRSCQRNSHGSDCLYRKRVNFTEFPYKSRGGLTDSDRELLADVYYNADSVFEFGIGESTAIAAWTNLPRYVGVDSSSEWISVTRSKAPDRFRFNFADVGPTREWGNPIDETIAKIALDYQVAPLRLELDPFDVYFVDGRWRVACVMASFLHAMHSGGDLNKIRVVLHDYDRRGGPGGSYGIVESIAVIEKRSEKAVVLAKRHNATTAEIFQVWNRYRNRKG